MATRRVGKRCLELAAAESDPVVLVRELKTALRAHGLYAGYVDAGRLQRSLAALRRLDFVMGDVVRVDGWVLSRNEARLYALAALDASPD